jgi:hypothetical protein
MDTGSWNRPARDMRISDADRDKALSELSEHFQAGRLTVEELDERSGRALQAKTENELAELFADLPRNQGLAQNQGLLNQTLPQSQVPPVVTGRRPARRVLALPIAAVAGLAVAVIAAIAAVSAVGHTHVSIGSGHGGFALPVLLVVFVVLRLVRGGGRRRRWR